MEDIWLGSVGLFEDNPSPASPNYSMQATAGGRLEADWCPRSPAAPVPPR